MVKINGILLSFTEVKRSDSKYSAIGKLYDIENKRLHQIYFPRECPRHLIEKLKTLKNKEITIEVLLPFNLIVATVFID